MWYPPFRLFLHVTVEITSFRLHHCQLYTIVIVLYLTLTLPLAHSNSTIDNGVIWIICYMVKEPPFPLLAQNISAQCLLLHVKSR